jgi:hypothetical protein
MIDDPYNSPGSGTGSQGASSVPPFRRASAGQDSGSDDQNQSSESTQELPLNKFMLSDRMADWLLVYVGRNPEPYAATYRRMVRAGKASMLSWSWSAFFFTFAWFFYRRMWLIGLVIMGLPGFLTQFGTEMATGALIATPFVSALMGKGLYLNRAFRRIYRIDRSPRTEAEKRVAIMDAGGVSYVSGVLGGVLILSVYGVIVLLLAGEGTETIFPNLPAPPIFVPPR